MDRLSIRIGIVIAVDVDFHLSAVAHYALSTMLERNLHVFAGCGADIVPHHLRLAFALEGSRVQQANAPPLTVRHVFFPHRGGDIISTATANSGRRQLPTSGSDRPV